MGRSKRSIRHKIIHNKKKTQYYNNKYQIIYPNCITNWYSDYYISRYLSIECIICRKIFCKLCHAIDNITEFICERCCNKQEFNVLLSTIKKSLSNYFTNPSLQKFSFMIATYSSGLTVNCGNFITCSTEINFKNEYQFNRLIDIRGKYIYNYIIDDARKLRDDLTYNFIYQRYYRLFCSYCTGYKLLECQHTNCFRKDVKIQNRIICSNHVYCEICKTPTAARWTLQNCKTCGKYLCDKCCYIYNQKQTCPNCYQDFKKKYFTSFLDDVIGVLFFNLTQIICDYCVGGAIRCQNKMVCHNEINIGERQNLQNNEDIYGDNIYWYPAKKQARKIGVFTQIYDSPLIVFCVDCTAYRLINCKFQGRSQSSCENKASLDTVCHIHPVCNFCGFTMKNHKHYVQCETTNCHSYICTYNGCSNKKTDDILLCNTCKMNDVLIISSLKKRIGMVGDMDDDHDCNYKCCNPNCGNEIKFEEKRKIYHYAPVFKENSIAVYDVKWRIFCEYCVENKQLKNCQVRGCVNKDVTTVCQNHAICNVCNSALTSRACNNCHKGFCVDCQCSMETDICMKCAIIKEKEMIIECFRDILRRDYDIKDAVIYNILAEYAMGYIVKCCNDKHDCNNEIIIDNEMDLHKNENIYGYVLYYTCNNISKVNIYNDLWRILCKDCSSKTRKCEYIGNYQNNGYVFKRKCNVIDVNYLLTPDNKRICYRHPICVNCKLIQGDYLCGEICNYCSIWVCNICIEQHMCKQNEINNEYYFEFNKELVNINRKRKGDAHAEIRAFKIYFSGDYGHKARKRKKRITYFERKNDRKSNARNKRDFYKKYALCLQY